MKENDVVVDIWVIQDGENPPFRSYMNYDQALYIQQVGLENAETIHLRETPDRKIPEILKQGQSCIMDIWVRLEPNTYYCLN